MGKKIQQTLSVALLLVMLCILYVLVHEQQRESHGDKSLSRKPKATNTLTVYDSPSQSRHAIIKRVLLRDTEEPVAVPVTKSPQSVFKRVKCKSHICRELLDKQDLQYFSYCWKKSHMKRETVRSTCRFLSTKDRAPVALASFPGSGNTWVRGLLQMATGVCTGGIYCDTTLRRSGYPGESLRSGKTLVIKTHQTDPRWTGVYYPPSTIDKYFTKVIDIPVYSSAIFLVRNPFDALVAEWNREMTVNMSDNHINSVGEERFRYNKKWSEFVQTQAVIWQDTVIGWLVNNHNHPVMVVKFEELRNSPMTELMMMLDFLEFPYSVATIVKSLRRGYSEFKRSHSNNTFEHFTPKQQAFVQTIIHNTIHVLQSHGLTQVCNLSEYLR